MLRAPMQGARDEKQTPDEALRRRVVWLTVFRSIIFAVLLVTSLLLRFRAQDTTFAREVVALYVIAVVAFVSVAAAAFVLRKSRAVVVATVGAVFGGRRHRSCAASAAIADLCGGAVGVLRAGPCRAWQR